MKVYVLPIVHEVLVLAADKMLNKSVDVLL